jgi:hypothetical protein
VVRKHGAPLLALVEGKAHVRGDTEMVLYFSRSSTLASETFESKDTQIQSRYVMSSYKLALYKISSLVALSLGKCVIP